MATAGLPLSPPLAVDRGQHGAASLAVPKQTWNFCRWSTFGRRPGCRRSLRHFSLAVACAWGRL